MNFMRVLSVSVVSLALLSMLVGSAPNFAIADNARGDDMLAAYFQAETQKLADSCTARLESNDNWNQHRDEYRHQLAEMLGLDPLPERTPLHATITGKLDHDEFAVEKLYFQ